MRYNVLRNFLVAFACTLSIICLNMHVHAGAALPPKFISVDCGNGSYGWSVIEDRNGDGVFDWITTRDCFGGFCSRPYAVIRPNLDTLPAAKTAEFVNTWCSADNYSWTVTELDSASQLTATISKGCSDTIPTVTYPPVLLKRGDNWNNYRKFSSDIPDLEFKLLYDGSNKINVTFDLTSGSHVVIDLLDNKGNILKRYTPSGTLSLGTNVVQIDVPSDIQKAGGWYMVRVQQENGTSVTTLVNLSKNEPIK